MKPIDFSRSEGQLRAHICIKKRLWTSDSEALEAAGAPRSEQESPKKPPRRPQVTIHRPCRWIMSSQGAAGNPQKAPKMVLGSQSGIQEGAEELHKGFEELKRRS